MLYVSVNDTGITPVTFSDWERIDAEEIKMGEQFGKPREKIVSLENMLDIVCRRETQDAMS